MCGFFDNFVDVLIVRVLVFTVFFIVSIMYIFSFYASV